MIPTYFFALCKVLPEQKTANEVDTNGVETDPTWENRPLNVKVSDSVTDSPKQEVQTKELTQPCNKMEDNMKIIIERGWEIIMSILLGIFIIRKFTSEVEN